jgi:two-component system, sensor histidine kinase
LPIIGLTANAYAEDRQRCLDAGMTDFVAKPVTRDKLGSMLRGCMALPKPVVAKPTAPTSDTMLDMAQLHLVLDELGPDLLCDLLDQLCKDAEALAQMVITGADGPAPNRLDEALHMLNGAAMTLGLPRAGNHCETLRLQKTSDPAALVDLVALVKQSTSAAQVAVRDRAGDPRLTARQPVAKKADVSINAALDSGLVHKRRPHNTMSQDPTFQDERCDHLLS